MAEAQLGVAYVVTAGRIEATVNLAAEGGVTPYYDRDGITVYVADCMDILPRLERVDHVITDPPYSEETHNGARSLRLAGGEKRNEYNDPEPRAAIGFSAISIDCLREVLALADPLRWTVGTMDWKHITQLHETPPDNMRFVRFGVWVKPNGAPQFTGDRPATGWEGVGVLHASGGKMRWNSGGKRAVWTHNVIHGDHETEKPLSLVLELVADFTDPGDLILDPFAGSLTTAVAAKHLGRRCIAIEREEKWAAAGVLRLEHGSKGAALVAAGQMPFEMPA